MIVRNEQGANAKGGTELLTNKLEIYLQAQAPELLELFDIFPSRVRPVENPAKFRVYYCHDLSRDPEISAALQSPDEWDLIVFVSHWQYSQCLAAYPKLNGHNCVVINNSIDITGNINTQTKFNWVGHEDKPLKLIYHTTPHRGLDIVLPAFDAVNKQLKTEGVHSELEVYSSFNLYGWAERDKDYEHLFEFCKAHPDINYHGTVSNSEIKKALYNTHIFAYASTWEETSCISLIEAMHYKNICVHSDLGALPETSGGLTNIYPFVKDKADHLAVFEDMLYNGCMQAVNTKSLNRLDLASERVEEIYNWAKIGPKWVELLRGIAETA